MSNAIKIMDYCNMTQKTPQSMEYFMHKKRLCRGSRPIIKKEIYEKHYIKGVSYINPNIEKLMTRNRSSIEKIMRVINANSMGHTR